MSESNQSVTQPTLLIAEAPTDRLSAVGFAVMILRQRILIIRVVLIAMILALLGALVARQEYTATSVFMPQGRSSTTSASMSGLAAQLGLSMGSGDPTQNPAFYADLIKSRAILGPTVAAFAPRLAAIYDVSDRDTAIVRERLRLELSKHVAAGVDARTGVVKLSVTTPDRRLSREINQELLDAVNEFNLRGRQSQAGAERAFVGKRLSEVQGELRAAEDRLAGFLRSNRNYQNSPDLLFAYNRLNRQVSDQQQLYSMLEQSYERSKIDEARDTPLITLIEAPNLPVRPDARGWGKKLAIAIVLGLFVGVALGYVRSLVTDRGEADSDDVGELRALASAARSDLRHPWRLLRSVVGIAKAA